MVGKPPLGLNVRYKESGATMIVLGYIPLTTFMER